VPRTPTPELHPSGRSNRKIRLPKRYHDELPPHPPSLPYQAYHLHPSQSGDEEDVVFGDPEDILRSIPPASESLAHHTCPNSYGVYQIYPDGEPSYSLDEIYSLNSVINDSLETAKDSEEDSDSRPWWATAPSSDKNRSYYAPFPTTSHFRLMCWFYDGSPSKTLSALDDLVQKVLLASDFKCEDLVGFRAACKAERLDQSHHTSSRFSANDGWIESSVEITLPAEGVKHTSERHAPKFEVPGLVHHQLLHIIKAALQESSTKHFHIFPYQEFWEPLPGSPPEHIYSELYTSNSFLAEHKKIHANCSRQDLDSGSELKNVIVAITLWSDSTHLTSFGNASLWPIYLYVGNLSKYI
jgi:hypothetical protein